jgi:hypothetical protein
MKTPSGFSLKSEATLEPDGVAIAHQVASPSVPNLEAVEAVTCVKLYRPFSDVFLERTYIHHTDGLELIASETPDRLSKNAEEWLPCRYIARCGKDTPPPEHLIERLDGVTRYFKSKPADAAFIATESQPTGWTVATHSIGVRFRLHKFGSDLPSCRSAARSIMDGKALLRLKVYIVKGTAKNAWDSIAMR